jgi:hypothetical protein
MRQLQQLRELFAQAEDERYTVEFTDGQILDVFVVSSTHVLLDDTVVALSLTSTGARSTTGPGVQFSLQDVRRVRELESGRLLFSAV